MSYCKYLYINILNLKIPPPKKSGKGFESNLHSTIANIIIIFEKCNNLIPYLYIFLSREVAPYIKRLEWLYLLYLYLYIKIRVEMSARSFLNFLKKVFQCKMLIISRVRKRAKKTSKKVLKIFGSLIFLPLLCIRFRA